MTVWHTTTTAQAIIKAMVEIDALSRNIPGGTVRNDLIASDARHALGMFEFRAVRFGIERELSHHQFSHTGICMTNLWQALDQCRTLWIEQQMNAQGRSAKVDLWEDGDHDAWLELDAQAQSVGDVLCDRWNVREMAA